MPPTTVSTAIKPVATGIANNQASREQRRDRRERSPSRGVREGIIRVRTVKRSGCANIIKPNKLTHYKP